MEKLISFIFYLNLLYFSIFDLTTGNRLSTNSRWIVDDATGQRVKLTCVNWPSHLQPVFAEGLSKRPATEIGRKIVALGFNCVRLTWPLDLMTNDTLANNVTVRQSFDGLGLSDDISGIQKNNPSLIDLSLIEAFKGVVTALGDSGVMVILDNHLTKPGWCCGNTDGNGFFGDPEFDPAAWTAGLNKMAKLFSGFTNVVGMSLRNELRGPRQNANDWYKYMQQGAEAVHSGNPNALVILSGLSFDKNLGFLHNRPVSVTFKRKLVFELHWYAFSDGSAWGSNNPNRFCGTVLTNVKNNAGFLLDKGFPLFVSEFGIDERGGNVNDNRYFNCFLGWAAENDVDWAVWALTGDYYLRQGVVGLDEVYGVLDPSWDNVRNASFLQRLSLIQSTLRGPGPQTGFHNLVFHPLTGLCLVQKSADDPSSLALGPCSQSLQWTVTPQNNLKIKGTAFCLKTDGPGKPVNLGTECSYPGSKWQTVSDSKMHLASNINNATSLCLDADATNNVVANSCKCMNGDSSCDPASQWFKIVRTTRQFTGPRTHRKIRSVMKLLPNKGLP